MRVLLKGSRRALLYPLEEEPVGRRVNSEALPAAVGDRRRGLEQDQAVLRLGPAEAPATRLLHDRLEVRSRVVTEQRQFEAALAVLRPVTRALIAAGPRESRHDLVVEADRRFLPGTAHLD